VEGCLRNKDSELISRVIEMFPDVVSMINQITTIPSPIWKYVERHPVEDVQYLLDKGWIPLEEEFTKEKKRLDPEKVEILEKACKLAMTPDIKSPHNYERGDKNKIAFRTRFITFERNYSEFFLSSFLFVFIAIFLVDESFFYECRTK